MTNDNPQEDSMTDVPAQDEPVVDVDPSEDVVTEEPVHESHINERHEMPPRPAVPNRNPHKSSTQIAREVWSGQWGDMDDNWQERVAAAGYNSEIVAKLVAKGVGQN